MKKQLQKEASMLRNFIPGKLAHFEEVLLMLMLAMIPIGISFLLFLILGWECGDCLLWQPAEIRGV